VAAVAAGTFAASHQTHFFASDQAVPSGRAEARL
jgi:hypothetical protein